MARDGQRRALRQDPADERDDVPSPPRSGAAPPAGERPRRTGQAVRPLGRGGGRHPGQGSPPSDGSRRASVLRAPAAPRLLRGGLQFEREPGDGVLCARVPGRDGPGPGRPGAPRWNGVMAEIVAAMAMTHAPGLTGWFTRAPERDQRDVLEATAEMRRRLQAARADVLVMFSNDHLLNWPMNNMPEYTVGIAAEHTGPADWFDEWLGMEKYRVTGEPGLARFIVNESARRGLALAHLGAEMQFDDGISVPTHYLNPDARFRLIPVTMNCTVPPIPTPERAYQVGSHLRDILAAYPGDERVAVIATGGLSHEPGGPRYFWVDEEFDRGFLDLLKRGDHAALLRECTLERMEAAGSGGTAELLSWVLVLAMTHGPADVLAYMPAIAWRSGTGMVVWNDMAP